MSLVKGRQCSESCLELLALELVRAYGRQSRVPPAAAVDAIGAGSCKQRCYTAYALIPLAAGQRLQPIICCWWGA